MSATWVSEATYTEGADGWTAYNRFAAEREFITWLAGWVQLHRPVQTVETGAGQGFTTRALVRACAQVRGHLAVVEHDADYHDTLEGLVPLGAPVRTELGELVTTADLLVLDSWPSVRLTELESWVRRGKPGSYVVLHDVRADYPPNMAHRRHYEAVAKLARRGIHGLLLPNPRGGWVARHP